MKKALYFSMAVAVVALASCAKQETEILQQNQGKSHVIHAVIDDQDPVSKTTYTDAGVFSWVKDDELKLIVYSASDGTKAANFYRYRAQSTAAHVDFACTGTPDFVKYPRAGVAVYPSDLTIGGKYGAYSVTLPASYSVSGTDFSAVKVPLIGTTTPDDGEDYTFRTAVGVLKVTLSNVPVAARKLVLTSALDNLSGVFSLDAENGLLMSSASDAGHSITVNFPQQTAGSTISVYIPVPVGTISAGATLEVQQSDGTAIKTTAATTKPITITRGHLTPISTVISVEDWVSLGTGKYMDDHGFYYLGNSGRTAEDYASVEIQQHATETYRYRIASPYATCHDVSTYIPNAAAYLEINLRPDLGTDMVVNHSYKYNNGTSTMFDCPYWGYDANYFNSRVIKYDGSGNPANIQLAPKYFAFAGDYTAANCAQNPKIEIVFPGATPMLANVFGYVASCSASYSEGNVTVTVGGIATAVKVKAATTIKAAVDALMEGDADLTFNESGSQALTGLASGNYYLIYKVETNGHGYTFVNAGTFSTYTEIPLDASMISVSIDAGKKDGSSHYDGAGKGALVDGDISTFWHTPWEANDDTYYNWSDLDATYGAYIDIDLGESKTVTSFQYRACLRNGSSDFPKHVVIYTSADGTTWTQVNEVANICSGILAGSWINPINCTSAAARYIRFSIIENTSGKDLRDPSANGCTHLAEIKIFE